MLYRHAGGRHVVSAYLIRMGHAGLAQKGINMSAFLTEAHGKVTNFPVSSGMGAALQQIVNDPGPAWLGSTSVSSALIQAGNDANYALKTGN